MKLITVALSILATAATGCAYQSPSKGPLAYVRFSDNMGPALGGGSKTGGAAFFDNADCKSPRLITSPDWVAVPATTVGFRMGWFTSGIVNGSCYVQANLELKEGQRVDIRYELQTVGLSYQCRAVATETGPENAPIKQLLLVPLSWKSCSN